MGASWVAGSTRARAMARRRLGTAGVRALALAGSAEAAVDMLSRSPYGIRVRAGASLESTEHAIADTLLWHMRVLAGWLPADGAATLRVLAGGFEIANIDEHVRTLTGQAAGSTFQLGALATSWPALAATNSLAELRLALERSPWGDPGGETPRDFQLGPRLTWAARVAAVAGQAQAWAAGAVALLVAHEIANERRLSNTGQAQAAKVIGPVFPVPSIAAFADQVKPAARWALADVRAPANLWLAEARWWHRLRQDGQRLVAVSSFGPEQVIGAIALLAADAAMTKGALELAATSGPVGLEVLDAMA